ncbi:MAG: cation-translocating P-type ATPase [Clostridia bacterium]|nr:cation-translocating P-type ATPase [Clostridia bacterium]
MDFHSVGIKETAEKLGSDIGKGLSGKETLRRLNENGENRLTQKKKGNLLTKFLSQFKDFMVITLLIAAAISFVTAYFDGEGSFVDPIIILGIVILNAIVGVIQESKAEHAIDRLRQMSAPEATVLRDGEVKKIPASQVVVGDIMLLSAGDCVAADARLTEAVGLKTSESSLTGEALPVEKEAAVLLGADTPLAERKNTVYSSSTVLAGHAKAIVTHTGMDTQIGRIADMIGSEKAPLTPLQLRLEKISKVLGIGAVAICAVIFILGVLRRDGILSSFMLSVSLAVAAIPEGLPAVVTIVLSTGVSKMAKNKAIIRKLTAVEALGSATYICSDKTGTLTQNKMTVCRLCSAYGEVSPDSEEGKEILGTAALCCNTILADAEPTEAAIIRAAAEQNSLVKNAVRLSEIPFSSEKKMMSVTVEIKGRKFEIIKGAPEKVIPLCSSVGNAYMLNDRLADDGLRVLAVAAKELSGNAIDLLSFIGLIAIEDPERKEAAQAVELCKQAGITPVMITGDNPRTASAIAARLGIAPKQQTAVTGAELDRLSDSELCEAVRTKRVFARVSPEHKVRIVKALRANGEVTAMTGDGVNDAPALKAADIGCAMGKGGTEVAKGAADIVLADDNFATIVKAVREGRGIYDNIKKVIHFLLSSNIGEIILVFAAGLMHLPAPMLPIQLLWTNLVTDSLPAMALGTEKADEDIMSRPPVDPKKGLFTKGGWLDIALEGVFIGALALLGFVLGKSLWGVDVWRTVCFCAMSIGELIHSYNSRSERSLFKIGIFSNKKMNFAFLICLLLQVGVVTVPQVAGVFGVVTLSAVQWAVVAALGAVLLAAVEISKRVKS